MIRLINLPERDRQISTIGFRKQLISFFYKITINFLLSKKGSIIWRTPRMKLNREFT